MTGIQKDMMDPDELYEYMTEKSLLCPFDKNPCVMNRCAVWSATNACCSFGMIPDLVKSIRGHEKPVRPQQEVSSGSGKYRTLLFE